MDGDPHVLVQVPFINFFNGRDPGTESAHRGWRSSCPGSGKINLFLNVRDSGLEYLYWVLINFIVLKYKYLFVIQSLLWCTLRGDDKFREEILRLTHRTRTGECFWSM
jgi:hypothetical protein